MVLRTVIQDHATISLRPLNSALFVGDKKSYLDSFQEFAGLLAELEAASGDLPDARKAAVRKSRLVGRTLYTTTQAIGCAMDCSLTAQTARKNFGTRFEEIVRDLLGALGFGQRGISFALPYEAAGVTQTFRNQVDLVVSEAFPLRSTAGQLDPDEVVLSIKTSSKDRFAKIFLDKEMLSFVTGQRIKVLAVFHNDVQRSGLASTSVTFVAGNFAAYVEKFGPLDGVYYVDPPPHISREPWSRYLRTFDDLLLADLWELF